MTDLTKKLTAILNPHVSASSEQQPTRLLTTLQQFGSVTTEAIH